MKNKAFILFLAGVTSVFALVPWKIFPVLFITLGYLFKTINDASTKKQVFLNGYWFGFGYFAFGLSWVGNALLIDALTFGWLYPVVVLASGAFFGLFFAFPALLSFYCKNIYSKFFAFCAWLTLFEWLRSFFLTGFPWNPLGSSLGFATFAMQSAAIWGIFGLSFIVLLITISPSVFWISKNKKILILPIFLVLLLVSFGLGRYNKYKDLGSSDVTIRLVQPAIAQEMKWNQELLEYNFQQYINLSSEAGLNDANLVIWGETATPFALEYEPEYIQRIKAAIPQNGYLITGLLRYEFYEKNMYQPLNSMAIIDKSGEIKGSYDKSHLVPFGEYIPLRDYLPSFIRPITGAIANFKPGDGPKTFKLDNIPSFGGSICYEIIFPGQTVDKENRPDFLINLTNDGWYGNSQGPYQHLLSAQMRALEEGISIIRVANTGISALISPLGEILDSIPLSQRDVLDVKLPNKTSIRTAYSLWGNWFIVILCFFILAFCYQPKKTNNTV